MSGFRTALALGALVIATTLSAMAVAQERASPVRPGGPGDPGFGQMPPGSYQSSCRGISMDGNILRAQCPGPRGPISSSIDINSCRGRDIANDRGYLRCEGGGGGPQPPRPPNPGPGPGPGPLPPTPPGRYDAIAYTEANYRGRELVIRQPIANLANYRGFNDNIRSIRITRGRVEVCADSLYRGRCATLRQSYRDLRTIGMANSISSIR